MGGQYSSEVSSYIFRLIVPCYIINIIIEKQRYILYFITQIIIVIINGGVYYEYFIEVYKVLL